MYESAQTAYWYWDDKSASGGGEVPRRGIPPPPLVVLRPAAVKLAVNAWDISAPVREERAGGLSVWRDDGGTW